MFCLTFIQQLVKHVKNDELILELKNFIFMDLSVITTEYSYSGRLCHLDDETDECDGPYDPKFINDKMLSPYRTLTEFPEFKDYYYPPLDFEQADARYSIRSWPITT